MSTPWLAIVCASVSMIVVSPGHAQTALSDAALRAAVWAAVQPALPYPVATSDDTPEDGRAESRWLVRTIEEADGAKAATAAEPVGVVEVVANPLNRDNQTRALQAMEDIQNAVAAAERKAQAEFERTLGTTSRQQPTRELTGISLYDEGVAGERADWEVRLVVEARRGLVRYEWSISGSGSPSVASMPPGASRVSIDSGEYDEGAGPDRRRRFRPAETRLFFGTATPAVKPAANERATAVIVESAGTESVEVALRGHAELVQQVVAKADWARVAALVKR